MDTSGAAQKIDDLPTLEAVMVAAGAHRIERDAAELFGQSASLLRFGDTVLVFRHDDLRRLGARDEVIGVPLEPWLDIAFLQRAAFDLGADELGQIRRFFRNVITNLTLEAHAIVKPLFMRAVSPKAMQDLAPVMERLANARVEAVCGTGTIDLQADFYTPLAIDFWSEVLALDDDQKSRLIASLPGVSLGVGSRVTTRDELALSDAALADYLYTIGTAMRRAREAGTSPFVDAIIDRFETLGELPNGMPESIEIGVAASLSDGFGTMPLGAAICAGLLFAHPAEHARVREDQRLISSAVSEGLRLRTPLYQFNRYVMSDICYNGIELPANTHLTMLWGAGNYDPAVYDRPAAYDLSRKPSALTGFGTGTQLCPGRNLATMMAQSVLKILTGPSLSIRLEGEIEWLSSEPLPTINKMLRCPVSVERS